MSPVEQNETVGPGENCFEVTMFANGAKPEKKYFYVKFEDFKGIKELEEIKKQVKHVKMENISPW